MCKCSAQFCKFLCRKLLQNKKINLKRDPNPHLPPHRPPPNAHAQAPPPGLTPGTRHCPHKPRFDGCAPGRGGLGILRLLRVGQTHTIYGGWRMGWRAVSCRSSGPLPSSQSLPRAEEALVWLGTVQVTDWPRLSGALPGATGGSPLQGSLFSLLL